MNLLFCMIRVQLQLEFVISEYPKRMDQGRSVWELVLVIYGKVKNITRLLDCNQHPIPMGIMSCFHAYNFIRLLSIFGGIRGAYFRIFSNNEVW